MCWDLSFALCNRAGRLAWRAIAILAFIVIVGILGLAFFGSRNAIPGGLVEKYPKVTVIGEVETVGLGTTPNRVNFVSNSGSSFSALVDKGTYSVTLPNRAAYRITVN